MQNLNETHVTIFRSLIERGIADIVREEADAAGKRVEARVRENVGGIVARIMRNFSMRSGLGDELVISVRFDGKE